MDRSSALIDTYRIPTQKPYDFAAQGGGNGQEASFNDNLDFEKNLQEVEGLTSNYYQKVAALKAFMSDVHKNLGLDVRVPDVAHPESIKLNQIYQKALYDIMYTGNKLHTGQTERQSHIQMGDVYNRSSRGRADSELTQGVDFHAKSLDPAIVEINNLTQQPSYDDQSYAQKYATYDEMKQHLIKAMKEHPDEAETIQYQLNGLTPPARAIKQFAPQRSSYQERMAGRKMEAAGNILKEITNLQHGVSDGYKISKTTSNPNKPEDPLMVRPNFQDATYNGKHIKEWGHDPKTNETFVFFDDGSIEDVTKQDPLTIARVMLGSNKGTFGVDAEYLDEWADKKGVVKEDGTIDQSKLLRSNSEKVKEQNLKTYEKDITAGQVQNLGKFLEDIQNKTSYWIGSNAKGLVKTDISPNPAIVKKKSTGSGKLYISNFDEIFRRPSDKKKLPAWIASAAVYGPDGEGVDASDMRKFLQKYGAHLHLDKATQEEGKTAPQVVNEAKETMQERIERLKREAQNK